MSAIILARLLALGAVAGATFIAGYAAGQDETDNDAKRKVTLDEALQLRLANLGRALLRDRKDLAASSQVDLRGYLKQTYRGLYCIGRSAHKLPGDSAASYADELAHLHLQLRPRKDAAIVQWYRTSGNGTGDSLVELLRNCPEVKQLGVDPRYIAFALGEASENLPFGGLSEEIVERFAA